MYHTDSGRNINLSKNEQHIVWPVRGGTVIPRDTFSVPATSRTLAITITDLTIKSVTATGYKITEVSTKPLATATGWSATKPVSYTATAAGIKTLYAWFKDSTGKVYGPLTATVTIDITKPVITAFTVTTPVNTLTVPVTAFTITETGSGIAGYLITPTATAPLVDAAGWSESKPTSYTFAAGTAAGAKTLYAWAKDTAGNVSLAKTAAATIDITPPAVGTFTIPAVVKSLSVTGILLSATDNVAVGSYQITEDTTPPAADDADWKTTKPTSYTLVANTPDGPKTLYAWARDKAGNVSLTGKSATFTLKVPPVVDTFTVAPLINDSLTIPVTAFDASDNTAVNGYLITLSATAPLATATGWSGTAPGSYTVTTEGIKTLYAWARDTAGNVSLAKKAVATVDRTKPVVSAFTLPVAVKSLAVPFTTLTATDNVAVAAYQITETAAGPDEGKWSATKPASYTFAADTTDGLKTLYAWTKDTVGNVSLARAATMTIDRVLPQVTAFAMPTIYKSLTVPVSIFTASDTGSGVAGYLITPTATEPLATATGWSATKPVSVKATVAGSNTFYAWVKDKAGNVAATPTSASVNIDLTKPVVDIFTVPASVTGLTIPISSLIATDNNTVGGYLITLGSVAPLPTAAGWTADPPTVYTITTKGAKVLYAWAKDTAGNVSLSKTATVTVY